MIELEKLLAEATPGPWGYDTLAFVDGQALLSHTGRLGVLTIPDAALICAAVNALPEMLAKVKRYEAALSMIHRKSDPEAEQPNPSGSLYACYLAARAALNQETKP